MAQNKLINYITNIKGSKLVINELKKMKAGALGLDVANKKVTRTLKLTDNTLLKVGGTYDKTGRKLLNIKAHVEGTTRAFASAHPIMSQYQKALARVAIVVPLWTAFRVVMQAVTSTIRAGYEQIKKLSEELLRASSVITGTVLTTGAALDLLREKVRGLSTDSGISMDKLVNSFYKFGTVGNNFEASMGGMTASMQTALAMQGDITQVSKTMALTYKLLGDTMDQSLSPFEQQRLMGAQLFKLYRSNAFEISDMNAALMQFLPTAKTANFSYAQTISLLGALQSAGLKSSRAGRLLRTSTGKLISNLDLMASELNIAVNPALDSTHDVMMKVLEAIKLMESSGQKLPLEQLKSLKNIFGGIRSQEAAKALVGVLDLIKQNLADTAATAKQNAVVFNEFNERLADVSASTSNVIQRNENLQKVLGETFLTGITGSKDFGESVLILNKFLKDTIKNTEMLTGALNKYAQGGTMAFLLLTYMDLATAKANAHTMAYSKALEALKGNMPIEDMKKLLDVMNSVATVRLFDKDKTGLSQLRRGIEDAIELAQGKINAEVQVKWDMDVRQLNSELQGNLRGSITPIKVPLEVIIAQEKADASLASIKESLNDTTKMQSAENALNKLISSRVEKYNKIASVKDTGLSLLTEEFVKTNALNGTYENIVGVMTEANNSKAFMLKLVAAVLKYEVATLKTRKELADTERKQILGRLSARGASGVQVAQKSLDLAISKKEIEKAQYKLEIAHIKEMEKGAKTIRKLTQSTLADAMKEGDFSGAFDNFKEGLKNAFIDAAAEGLTNQIMNITGLDDALGMNIAAVKMERAMDSGSVKLVNALDGAFTRGAQKLTDAGKNISGGTSGAGTIASQFPGLLKSGQAFNPGLKSVDGLSIPVAAPDYYKSKAAQPGTPSSGMFDFLKNPKFQAALGTGLLAASIFGGGSKSSTSNAFATKPGRTAAATTRSTVKAVITNITVAPVFNLPEGLGTDGENLVKAVESKITPLIKDITQRILEDENIGSGNV